LYRAVWKIAGLDYRVWVGVMFALHALACGLLYTLQRRLGRTELAALCATLVFALHPALFAAWWKPMYCFDVLCAVWTLTTLLLWATRRRVLALAAFWLAYKSKEIAIAIPVALLAMERTPWLIPFFAVSACFGGQALLANSTRHASYRLSASVSELWRTVRFYAPHFAPVLAAPWVGMWAGAALVLTVGPVLLLPHRLFTVYLYVPLLGVSLILAAAFDRLPVRIFVPGVALFLLFSYGQLREFRRVELTIAAENRALFNQVAALPDKGVKQILREGDLTRFENWGWEGVLRRVGFPDDVLVKKFEVEDGWAERTEAGAAVFTWDAPQRRLLVSQKGPPMMPHLTFDNPGAVWQLERGFLPLVDGARAVRMSALLRLVVPEGAKEFDLAWRTTSGAQPHELNVLIDGQWLGAFPYVGGRRYATQWPVRLNPGKVVVVEVQPGADDSVAVERVGFR
jgi:hypothetical protein